MYLLPLHLLPIFLYPHPLIPKFEQLCCSDPKISLQFLFSSKFQAEGEREEERRESVSKAHLVLPEEPCFWKGEPWRAIPDEIRVDGVVEGSDGVCIEVRRW